MVLLGGLHRTQHDLGLSKSMYLKTLEGQAVQNGWKQMSLSKLLRVERSNDQNLGLRYVALRSTNCQGTIFSPKAVPTKRLWIGDGDYLTKGRIHTAYIGFRTSILGICEHVGDFLYIFCWLPRFCWTHDLNCMYKVGPGSSWKWGEITTKSRVK